MSTHYLVDLFTNPMGDAPIIDVLVTQTGASQAQAGHIIRVSDDVSVQNPGNLADLLTKKYAGLLGAYPGFAYVTYDDLLDDTGIDLAAVPAVSRHSTQGTRGSISLGPSSILQTTANALSAIPSQAYVLFELYRWSYIDPSGQILLRTYEEVDHNPVDIIAEVSFNNGLHWYAVTDGVLLNIPALGQGAQFMIRWITAPATPKTWVGSWAVVY